MTILSYKLVVVSGWKKEGKNTNPESDKKRVVKKGTSRKEFSVLLRMIPSLSGFCHSDDPYSMETVYS